MRKLFLLLVAGVGLVAVSCKKCQVCTTNTKQVVNGFEQTTTSKKEYCGSDYDNAPATGTYNQTVGGTVQEVTISCSDK